MSKNDTLILIGTVLLVITMVCGMCACVLHFATVDQATRETMNQIFIPLAISGFIAFALIHLVISRSLSRLIGTMYVVLLAVSGCTAICLGSIYLCDLVGVMQMSIGYDAAFGEVVFALACWVSGVILRMTIRDYPLKNCQL